MKWEIFTISLILTTSLLTITLHGHLILSLYIASSLFLAKLHHSSLLYFSPQHSHYYYNVCEWEGWCECDVIG